MPLSYQILQKHCENAERNMPTFSACAEKSLLAHPWFGNVRELDNVLQRALILQPGQIVTAKDLAFETMAGQQELVTRQEEVPSSMSLGDDLRSHEQRHIIEALEKNNCSRRLTAKELGISERTLRYKISSFREQGIAIPEKNSKKTG
jgi:two-component system response regulator FlrC